MDSNGDVMGWMAPQYIATGIMGPLFVAWSLQLFLAGICVTAFYYYVRDGHLSRDSTHVKIVAVSVLGLNTAIGLFCGVLIFQSGVSQNRSTDQLWSSSVLLCLQPTFAAMVGFLVQGWFARRGSLLFRKKSYKVLFLSLAGLGMLTAWGGMTYFNFCYSDGIPTSNLDYNYSTTTAIWYWSSSFVDVINTVTLCYLLRAHVVGFNVRTDTVLTKMIKLALETASYTAVFSTVAAIESVVVSQTSYITGDLVYVFWVPLPSLYTISLFTTLSSRDQLSAELSGVPITSETRPPQTFTNNKSTGLPIAMSYVNVLIDVQIAEERGEENDLEDDESRKWNLRRDRERKSFLGGRRPLIIERGLECVGEVC